MTSAAEVGSVEVEIRRLALGSDSIVGTRRVSVQLESYTSSCVLVGLLATEKKTEI